MDDLIRGISRFCRQTGIAETTFGRLAVNDGKLIGRLRAGRVVREKTRQRIVRFIEEHEKRAQTPSR